jgi:hypothetical protein
MTRGDRSVFFWVLLAAVCTYYCLSIPDGRRQDKPDEYAAIIATWDNGRQTISFRVGDYYYIEKGGGMAEQHAGVPKKWEYAE